MSDANLVRRRADAQAGQSGGSGRVGRIATSAAIIAATVLTLAFVFAPQTMRDIFTWATSRSEEMQQTITQDGSISTDMTRREEEESEPLDVAMPVPRPVETAPEPDGRAEQLEKDLAALRQQMEDRAQSMQDDFDSQMKAQEASYKRQLDELTRLRTAGISPASTGEDAAEREARQRLAEERARRQAIANAQITSPSIVLDGASASGGRTGGGPDRDLSADEEFLAASAAQTHETVRATQIGNPSRTIVQGTILEATLETAITTDLPGAIRAVLAVDVTSYDGENVLMPRGTRLIGTYNSDVSIAQRRALIAWNRAITPDGRSVALGGIGADQLGRSGQTGQVNTHFGTRFGTAALISLIGVTPQLLVDDRSDGDTVEIVEDVGKDLKGTTRSTLDEYLRIKPTINIAQGERMSVFVNRDLVL